MDDFTNGARCNSQRWVSGILPWWLGTLLRFSETCELCSSQQLLRNAFFAAVNLLSGPLRKQKFALTGSKGHVSHLWLVNFDPFCLFLFFKVRYLSYNYDWRQRKTYFRSNRWLEQSSHVSENRNNLYSCASPAVQTKSLLLFCWLWQTN